MQTSAKLDADGVVQELPLPPTTSVHVGTETELLRLQEAISTFEKTRTEWYEPEIARLQDSVAQSDLTKTEWYEPELNRRQSEIDRLRAENSQLSSDNLALQKEIERLAETSNRLSVDRIALAAQKTELEVRIRDTLEPHLTLLATEAAGYRAELAGLNDEKDRLVARLDAEQAALSAEHAELEKRIRDTLEPQIEEKAAEVDLLREELAELKEERETLAARLETTEETLSELQTRETEFYEPELARLRSHVEHSKFEKEVHFLRSRVMAYAEQARRAMRTVNRLEKGVAEVEKRKEAAAASEIARLTGILQDYERTKKDWWDPQLEKRAGRIAELEAVVRQLENTKQEWFEPQIELRSSQIAALEEEVAALREHIRQLEEKRGQGMKLGALFGRGK